MQIVFIIYFGTSLSDCIYLEQLITLVLLRFQLPLQKHFIEELSVLLIWN